MPSVGQCTALAQAAWHLHWLSVASNHTNDGGTHPCLCFAGLQEEANYTQLQP